MSLCNRDILHLLPEKMYNSIFKRIKTVTFCICMHFFNETNTNCSFRECKEAIPSKEALDDGVAKKLWEVSEGMVGLD